MEQRVYRITDEQYAEVLDKISVVKKENGRFYLGLRKNGMRIRKIFKDEQVARDLNALLLIHPELIDTVRQQLSDKNVEVVIELVQGDAEGKSDTTEEEVGAEPAVVNKETAPAVMETVVEGEDPMVGVLVEKEGTTVSTEEVKGEEEPEDFSEYKEKYEKLKAEVESNQVTEQKFAKRFTELQNSFIKRLRFLFTGK